MDNLPLLKDIHLPPEVSAFPPGYGWAVMAAFILFIYVCYRIFRYVSSKSKKTVCFKTSARGFC